MEAGGIFRFGVVFGVAAWSCGSSFFYSGRWACGIGVVGGAISDVCTCERSIKTSSGKIDVEVASDAFSSNCGFKSVKSQSQSKGEG